MSEYYGDPDFAAKLGNAVSALGTATPDCWHEVRPNVWQDEFGVQWNREVDRDIGVVCNTAVTPDTLAEYGFPDPHDPRRWEPYESLASSDDTQFRLANLGFSLFERAWTLCGMERLLMAMVDTPSFAHALLDRILEYNLAVIEHACRYPIQAMMFGDDWGSQYGLLMGPELWRQLIKPRIRQMYQAVRGSGKYVFIHSCGIVDELFPDLIECGLDCFNPFQPEVMDVFAVKRTYGHRLSFWGGISTQSTLPYGTVDQVREQVRRLLELVGKNGGYIAAPAHDVPADAKPENVAAMIEVLQNQ
jgi:uroporphyrinogen decarboxylase